MEWRVTYGLLSDLRLIALAEGSAANNEAEEAMEFIDDPTVHAVCAICRKPVRDGERVVSIARNLEQIEPDGAAHNVLDSVVLASLCESCGSQYSEQRIRVVFE